MQRGRKAQQGSGGAGETQGDGGCRRDADWMGWGVQEEIEKCGGAGGMWRCRKGCRLDRGVVGDVGCWEDAGGMQAGCTGRVLDREDGGD